MLVQPMLELERILHFSSNSSAQRPVFQTKIREELSNEDLEAMLLIIFRA